MPTIWEPPNRHALPTPIETRSVEESINSLETQLQSAMADPISAKETVATLQQQIEEQRAWIAPIRRLPHDILSIIFLDVCEDGQWRTPLYIAEVCRVWRQSMLATPRAWSHLSLSDIKSHEMHSLYFARSAPCPLHISVPFRPSNRTMSLIGDVTERIQCLNIELQEFLTLEGYPFPLLERLHTLGDYNVVDKFTNVDFMLNPDLFPSLRSLGVHGALDTIQWRTLPFASFVPLQELKFAPKHPVTLELVLKHCCETLTSLSVDLGYIDGCYHSDKPETILFPRLYHLSIWDTSIRPVSWTIDAKTPNLQTYTEAVLCLTHTGPIHKDTGAVVALRFSAFLDISLFPSLHQVEPAGWNLRDTVEKLCDDPTMCPDLELIAYSNRVADSTLLLAKVKEIIASRNAQTGGTIRLGPGMQHGVFAYTGIESHCGKGMPCYSQIYGEE